jgi:hypothetical protein
MKTPTIGVHPRNLALLGAMFDPGDLEWRPLRIVKANDGTERGLAAAYVTNRAIMDRLDAVCGPHNWQNVYAPTPNDPKHDSLECGIGIRILNEITGAADWVWKYDASDNSDMEPIKGGYSGSMKRSAVQWGIGRYLYTLDSAWMPIKPGSKSLAEIPKLGHQHLPPPAKACETLRAAAVEVYALEAEGQLERLCLATSAGMTHLPEALSSAQVAMLLQGITAKLGTK